MYYSFSRLAALDVRWADEFDANLEEFQDAHHNPYYELIVVSEGPVYLQAESGRMTLRTGESVLLMPWEHHFGWKPEAPQGRFFWAQFTCEPGFAAFHDGQAPDLKIVHAPRTELRTSEVKHEDQVIVPRLFSCKQRFRLLHLFEELVEASKHPKGYSRFQASLLLGSMLHLIGNEFLENTHQYGNFPVSYLTFRKLVGHLNDNYMTDVSKEELEKVTDRKYEYLCQVFKRYADTSILQYVHRLRTQRAKHLLLNSHKSIREIAESVGYQDPFYFSRMFKRMEGMSPQHYRELNIQPPT